MHIVINGQIRHIACYRFLLQRISDALQAGTAESATLVHWRADVDTARQLAGAHPGKFQLLFLDEPEARSPGHFFHQALSLHEGMAERAPDDIVLRLRPDIFGQPGFLEPISEALGASAKRLWTLQADLTCPFFANDIIFGGRADALRAQTNASMEPYLALIRRSDVQPLAVHSHEPEIQRWLHPWRDDDWATRSYWRTFPNFGFSTIRRGALLRRFHDWDYFETVRLRWLRRLVSDIAIGGVERGSVFGLVRAETPTDGEATLVSFTAINERERFDDPATFEAETTELMCTTSDRKAADFLAYCEARAPQPRALEYAQVQEELAAIWTEAMTEPPGQKATAPVTIRTLRF